MITLSVETTEEVLLEAETAETVTLDAEAVIAIPPEAYKGEYTIEPSEEEQTISIAGKTATQDITISPIPSNYGLITYNGSSIIVS